MEKFLLERFKWLRACEDDSYLKRARLFRNRRRGDATYRLWIGGVMQGFQRIQPPSMQVTSKNLRTGSVVGNGFWTYLVSNIQVWMNYWWLVQEKIMLFSMFSWVDYDC